MTQLPHAPLCPHRRAPPTCDASWGILCSTTDVDSRIGDGTHLLHPWRRHSTHMADRGKDATANAVGRLERYEGGSAPEGTANKLRLCLVHSSQSYQSSETPGGHHVEQKPIRSLASCNSNKDGARSGTGLCFFKK